jgi:hypothetical protein
VKRPGYREAIEWLCLNDDTSWIDESDDLGPGLSIPAALVADLFGVDGARVKRDVQRRYKQLAKERG